MRFKRGAGILLHPTSLPGKFGIGDLGNEAFRFIDFLKAGGQTLWQIFPLGPTGYGDSPYQSFSAFAGNPLLISPEKLVEDQLLTEADLNDTPSHNPFKVDYGTVIEFKFDLLRKAFLNFKSSNRNKDKSFKDFCNSNGYWLDTYALFMAAKEYHDHELWTEWNKELVLRKEDALKKWEIKLADQILFQKFIQYEFYKQWNSVKDYANKNDIKIIGDMPIFISYDSADLWANKELFTVDEEGNLTFVAGVPPDYFSATGQLWGNPLYKWKKMEQDDYSWWRLRLSQMLELVDIIRIDHFRGFDAFWKVPGDAETAETGEWIKGPGEKFFNTVNKHLGKLPIIAEDLGLITKSVEELRDQFNFPGMKILQFAFGSTMEQRFLPHNIQPNSIVFTGSHDNDTTVGYFEKAKNENPDIYEHAQKYLNYFGDDLTGELIRTAYASQADLVVIPLQDILRFGTEARMNYPGKLGGNWDWRFTWEQIPYGIADHYKYLSMLYERPPTRVDEEVKIKVKADKD
jgi:4-alpha-glucanotransferase